MHRFSLVLLILVFAASDVAAKEESILVYEDRRVTIAVPEGFHFQRRADPRGMAAAIVDPQRTIILQVTFLPDPNGAFTSPRTRKEFLAENFHEYVECSVEQAMQFEELAPSAGPGTYCVLTDARLVRTTVLPPNEYRLVTVGMKASAGCVAVFTLLSDDTTSKEYATAMSVVRESLQVKP